MEKQVITRINGIEIAAVRDENNDFFVPVRPICDALTLNVSGQIQAVKRHRILGSVVCTLHTTGADGKMYDMVCLPLEFVYGWLFSIDTNLVAEERRELVEKYQLECYQALYNHFAGSLRRRDEENEAEIMALEAVNKAVDGVKAAKLAQREAEEHLVSIRKARLDDTPTLF